MSAEPEFRPPLHGYRPSKKMTREEAIAAVDAGIGSRPDLPPSEEIVRELRDRIWGTSEEDDSSMPDEPVFARLNLQDLSDWGPLSEDEANQLIRNGLGSRPDWPSGVEFVRQSRKAFRGLAPGG